jgi:glycerol-3-phosphate dehydrogenase (NAD(P)+)
MLQSEIVQEIFGNHTLGILSGPSFADEVAMLLPAALNFVSNDPQLSRAFKNVFSKSNLSIHLNEDIIGTQIGGIVKNVIAIGCGISSGLNLGNNMHAALIAQGLKEASILAKAKNGKKTSLLDFCGAGDMVLTCSSTKSRNFSFGIEISKGHKVEEIIANSYKAVEGYTSAKPLFNLAAKLKINLPLCNLIYKILYKELNPKLISSVL